MKPVPNKTPVRRFKGRSSGWTYYAKPTALCDSVVRCGYGMSQHHCLGFREKIVCVNPEEGIKDMGYTCLKMLSLDYDGEADEKDMVQE